MSFYTDRKRIEGAGSAHAGTEHFIEQRISAFALVPVMLLFIVVIGPLVGASEVEIRAAFESYWRGVIVVAAIIFMGRHVDQGLQVVIEDYVTPKFWRVLLLFVLHMAMVFLPIAAIWAVAELAFG